MERRRNARSISLFSREATRILTQRDLSVVGSRSPLLIHKPSSAAATTSRQPTAVGDGDRHCLSCRTSLLNREEQVSRVCSDSTHLPRLLGRALSFGLASSQHQASTEGAPSTDRGRV